MPVFSYELLLYPRRGSQTAETRDTVLRDHSLAYAVHERYSDNEHYDSEQLAPAADYILDSVADVPALIRQLEQKGL